MEPQYIYIYTAELVTLYIIIHWVVLNAIKNYDFSIIPDGPSQLICSCINRKTLFIKKNLSSSVAGLIKI